MEAGMGSVVKLSETACGLRKRKTRWEPSMHAPADLARLRALLDGDPLENWQVRQEAAEKRRVWRGDL